MELSIIAPTTNFTSYGLTTIHLVDALCKLNHKVSLIPIGSVSVDPKCQHTHESIKESLRRGQLEYNPKAGCLRLYHSFSQKEFVGNSKHISFVIFELDELNPVEKYNLNNVDAVITCSNWGKEVLDKELNHKNNFVVPLGVDDKIFYPGINNSKTTTYLVVGKTEFRKSSYEIVKAFNQTFKPTDNVKLKLAWTSVFNTKEVQAEWDRLAKSFPISPCVEIIPRLDSVVDIAELMRNSDAVISLSKAEGFNYPAIEALATSKHVIATRCTAQTDFLNDENSYLVDVDKKIIANDDVWFKSGIGKWYQIGEEQINQFSKHLQTIHECKQNGTLEPNQEGLATAKQFSWANSAKRLIEVLESF